MRPRFELLDPALIDRVVDEALQLLRRPGIKVEEPEAVALLVANGATADGERVAHPGGDGPAGAGHRPRARSACTTGRATRPRATGRASSTSTPGRPASRSWTPTTLDTRQSQAADLVRIVRVADALPAYDAVSTAIVAHDVPTEIGDLYRLFLVPACNSAKPVVTGAFTPRGSAVMIDLLALDAGGRDGPGGAAAGRLRRLPVAAPDLVRVRVPQRDGPRPGARPGRADLDAAGRRRRRRSRSSGRSSSTPRRRLAGIVLHQLAEAGSPIVWGGAPTIVDMRSGSTPMGAIETAMIDAGLRGGRQVAGPARATRTSGATDAKLVDAQAGLESGMTALIGGLAGIDMISGAGMLDFLLARAPRSWSSTPR